MQKTNNPYQDLANAIVAQAAEDYREALLRLRDDPDYERAQWVIKDVERFFHSMYYTLMTKVDPDYILSRIRAEVGV